MDGLKFEQACRFRSSGGYRFTATSEGFRQESRTSVEYFSDSMSPLFNDRTRRVLTGLLRGQDFVLALSTMHSDAMGRPALFNNVYVAQGKDYSEALAENAGLLVSFPLEEMCQVGPETEVLHPLGDVSVQDRDSRGDKILAKYESKYGLSGEKYAALLACVYNAMGEGGTVRLIGLDEEDFEKAILEIAYCVACGLPPRLRPLLSYSSAGDYRCVLCIGGRGASIGGTRATDYDFTSGTPSWPSGASVVLRPVLEYLASKNVRERAGDLVRMNEWSLLLQPKEAKMSPGFWAMTAYGAGVIRMPAEVAVRMLPHALSLAEKSDDCMGLVFKCCQALSGEKRRGACGLLDISAVSRLCKCCRRELNDSLTWAAVSCIVRKASESGNPKAVFDAVVRCDDEFGSIRALLRKCISGYGDDSGRLEKAYQAAISDAIAVSEAESLGSSRRDPRMSIDLANRSRRFPQGAHFAVGEDGARGPYQGRHSKSSEEPSGLTGFLGKLFDKESSNQ